MKYSRFWETATGDRVRSTLRGRCRSLILSGRGASGWDFSKRQRRRGNLCQGFCCGLCFGDHVVVVESSPRGSYSPFSKTLFAGCRIYFATGLLWLHDGREPGAVTRWAFDFCHGLCLLHENRLFVCCASSALPSPRHLFSTALALEGYHGLTSHSGEGGKDFVS